MGHYPRIMIPDIPHHIVHRGNNGKSLFLSNDDFSTYLSLLKHYSQKHKFKVLSYCLMSNHIHLVGIPSDMLSTSRLIRDVHQMYSSYLNQQLNASGHNWQNRYFSCACDEHHGIASMLYVERNPVRAGISRKACEYVWSSARVHVGMLRNEGILDFGWWNERFTYSEWIEMLNRDQEKEFDHQIQWSTKMGIPLGSMDFVENILGEMGDDRLSKRRGRPKNAPCANFA